jgi:excisionase family DNA binding protein
MSAVVLPLTLSVEEAAKLLGISRGLCYQGVRDGSIPSISIGRRRLVPRTRLLELLGEPAEGLMHVSAADLDAWQEGSTTFGDAGTAEGGDLGKHAGRNAGNGGAGNMPGPVTTTTP